MLFRIENFKLIDKKNLLGTFNIRVNKLGVFTEFKLCSGKNGMFVGSPSIKDRNSYTEINFLSKEAKEWARKEAKKLYETEKKKIDTNTEDMGTDYPF